jgi:hypothetical protein
MAHHLHFDEVGRDRFKSRDGRFLLRHEQRNGHHDFYIFDAQSKTPEREVGRATTMTKVVSFCRQYLNKERDAMITGVRQAEKAPTVKAGVERSKQQKGPPPTVNQGQTGAQRAMAACCEAADKDGVFSITSAQLGRRVGVSKSQAENYLRQFMAVGWIILLDHSKGGTQGSGNTYGFNIPIGDALCYVREMPELPSAVKARAVLARQAAEEQRRKAAPVLVPPPAAVPAEAIKVNPANERAERAADAKPSSEVGLMAGRAMVKVGRLEDRVLALEGSNDLLRQLIKELQERVASLESIVKQLATAPARNEDEYAGVLEYLEQSQRRINAFLKSAFGVDVEGGE